MCVMLVVNYHSIHIEMNYILPILLAITINCLVGLKIGQWLKEFREKQNKDDKANP